MTGPISRTQSSCASAQATSSFQRPGEDEQDGIALDQTIFKRLIPLSRSFACCTPDQQKLNLTQLPNYLIVNIFFINWKLSGSPKVDDILMYGCEHLFDSEPRYHQVIRRVAQEAFQHMNAVSQIKLESRLLLHVRQEEIDSFLHEPENEIIGGEKTEKILAGLARSTASWMVETFMQKTMRSGANIYYFCPSWLNISQTLFDYFERLSKSEQFLSAFVDFIAEKKCENIIPEREHLSDLLKKITSKDSGFFNFFVMSDPMLSMAALDEKKEMEAIWFKQAKVALIQYMYARALLVAVDSDPSKRNSLLLIQIIQFCFDYIKEAENSGSLSQLRPEDRQFLLGRIIYFEKLINTLKAGGAYFLRQSPKQFEPSALSRSNLIPKELVQASKTCYLTQSTMLAVFYSFWKLGYSVIPQYFLPRQGVEAFRNFHRQQINQQIHQCDRISPATRATLQLLVNRTFNRLNINYQNSTELFQQFASGGSLLYFCFIFDKEPDISKLLSQRASVNERRLGRQYRERYETFVPRLRELSSKIHSFSDQNARDLLILCNFSSFLKEGDIDALINQIGSVNNAEIQDEIFYQTIAGFAHSRRHLPVERLQEVINRGYKGIEMQCVSTPKMLAGMLDIWMFDDQPCLDYLFGPGRLNSTPIESLTISDSPDPQQAQLDSETGRTRRKKRKKKRNQNSQPVASASSSSSQASSSQPRPVASASSSSSQASSSQPQPVVSVSSSPSQAFSSQPQPVASISSSLSQASSHEVEELQTRLERNRSLLDSELHRLSEGQSPHVKRALQNSYQHFDNLLCNLSSLKSAASRGEMTSHLLFSFVNDCVRYSTLGTEQLLTALYQKTRKVDTELPVGLTHNLYILLQGCRLTETDIPDSLRGWVEEINRGEIIVRNRKLIPQQNTVLTRLLQRNYQLLDPQSTASRQLLFQELSAYLAPIGQFLNAMHEQFLPSQEDQEGIGQRFSEDMMHFCQMMSSYSLAPSSSISDNPASRALSDLRSQLQGISNTSSQVFGELDNVLTNSLVHLETQGSFQEDLEPIETSLRLSNTLLLNQQIVESVLLHQLYAAAIPITDEDEYQHNLMGLLQKLKIPLQHFTPNEIEFLTTARACRQCIRYPASTEPAPKGTRLGRIEELLRASRQLASSQAAGQDLRGFTVANRSGDRLKKIRALVETDIKTMASIVDKVLRYTGDS